MKNKKKGFTLAELLVVVAIIAVLVVIAIPVFKGATDRAAKAADQANLRAAYAEATVNMLTTDGVSGTATSEKMQSKDDTLIDVQKATPSAATFAVKNGKTVTVTVDAEGYATYTNN